jgi:hypothetical protein
MCVTMSTYSSHSSSESCASMMCMWGSGKASRPSTASINARLLVPAMDAVWMLCLVLMLLSPLHGSG